MKNYFHEKGSSAVNGDAVGFFLTCQIVQVCSILFIHFSLDIDQKLVSFWSHSFRTSEMSQDHFTYFFIIYFERKN